MSNPITTTLAAVVPELQGPVPGPITWTGTEFEPQLHGYVCEEFFLSGHARSFCPVGEHGDNGRWSATAAAESQFTTRIVVYRPVEETRFNGTVFVEWLNVTRGLDGAPDWLFLHRHLMRNGSAWVGVSAQKVGIDGGGFVAGDHLKLADPKRYGHLQHPGDEYSYDIFTQAGRAVRAAAPCGVLGPLTAVRVVAAGESQSAMCLVTYVNAIDPLVQAYDAFLIHGRGAQGAPLVGQFIVSATADGDSVEAAARRKTGRHRIRDDTRVPVLTVQSETDVVRLGGGRARQPDGPLFRLWEVAGAAHFDTYGLSASVVDDGSLSAEQLARRLAPTDEAHGIKVSSPLNSGPQQHYVLNAAAAHLERWVRDGVQPPTAVRLETAEDASDLVLDEHGIGRGGVRTPWVDVPTATLSGLGQSGDTFAFLFGRTDVFSPERLAALYPGGRSDYLARFVTSLDDVVAAGFLLAEDREEILALAAASWLGTEDHLHARTAETLPTHAP